MSKIVSSVTVQSGAVLNTVGTGVIDATEINGIVIPVGSGAGTPGLVPITDGAGNAVWSVAAKPTTNTAVLNFGSAPGTNNVSVAVTGQASILTTSVVQLWMQDDSTSTHNAYEHLMVPLTLRPSNIIAGTGFTINASTDWRLDGTFSVRWEWE
jgi:hypothetical protein